MLRRFALVASLLAAAACSDPAGPVLPHGGTVPTALDIGWSGYGAGSTRIRLVDGVLQYTYVPWDYRPGRALDTLRVAVTPERWAAFWATADAVGLRTWPRTCENRDVADGGGMSVEVVHDGGRLALSTTNASPGRNGRCDHDATTSDEATFRAAVAALVGAPFPGTWRRATELPGEGAPYALSLTVQRLAERRVVAWRGDTLLVARQALAAGGGVRVDTARVVPAAEAWRAFWRALDGAGVVRWPSECVDPRVADGTSVHLLLETRLGDVRTFAANAYPQPDGRCVTASESGLPPAASAPLDAVLAAVGALVGQPFP